MPEGVSLLGFDYGARRIGVAVGQTVTHTATPLATIAVRGSGVDWQAIEQFIRGYEPAALIVGLPSHQDGSEHLLASSVRRFGEQLRQRYRLPVHFIDERLSSHEAAASGETRKMGVDAVAAQVILESWLREQARGESTCA